MRMPTRMDPLAVCVPGLKAVRLSSDTLHVGMKEYYAVARVESGQSEWWSRGKVWHSEPGSLQLQQPGDVRRELARPGPITYQIISFAPESVERVTGKILVHPQLAADDARGAPFQRLHDAVQRGADRLALEVAIAEAISAFAAVSGWRSQETRPVRRALELLRERLAEPLTLDDLAAHADFDKYHLCRAFRAQIGMPPHAYLTQLRIMRAKQLLDAGERPSEVAPQVGLYDQSQLNRHFRRLVGTTPGRYAEQRSRRAFSALS
jgi:AraC-like DNA-binding protein